MTQPIRLILPDLFQDHFAKLGQHRMHSLMVDALQVQSVAVS